MYYKISNGSVTLTGNTILENIDFKVSDHEKIGIVGRNGSGKTTLLKAITNEVDLEDGYDKLQIDKVGNFNIGYLKQNVDNDSNLKMIDYILDVYSDLVSIEKEMEEVEVKLIDNYNEDILNKYNDLMIKYEYLGGYTYKKEYEIALNQFGFTNEDKEKKLSEFSGGQLTKLSLVRLLLSKPDLLILDEPTNHLDIKVVEWLEDYLKKYNKSIIIVSHDRMFLDNVCNVIYDIENGTLKRYEGNYSYFLKKKEEDYLKQEKDYELQQKEIKRLQEIADRFRYKPSKAKMAMSKLKQIERMVKIDKPQKENKRTFKINFSPIQESYRDVLKVKNLSIGYDKELSKVSFDVERGDKLGIIGENGIGKSTLLKTITGIIEPLAGKYVFGDKANIGYFSQQLENLDNNNTIYEEIDKAFPSMSQLEIRSVLGAFDFHGEEVFKYISSLSGGEKVRVSLCKILNSRPNILILDEPTNHLDIINKDTIEKMLKDYKGTIIMVSHDRYLIKNVCNKLLVFNPEEVKLYNYGYDEYLQKSKIDKEKNINKNEIKKEVTRTLSKEIHKLEKIIDSNEQKVKQLNQELLKEEVYMDINKSRLIQEQINNLNKEVDIKTKEWEALINKM